MRIAGLAGLIGLMGYSPYAMSKFAVRGLSEVLQMELVDTNVTVMSVHPGGVKTNIMRNAPDFASAAEREEVDKFFQKGALTPVDKAAKQIIKGMQKKKYKIIIGKDAKLVNFLHWLFPNRSIKMLNPVFKQMMLGSTEDDA